MTAHVEHLNTAGLPGRRSGQLFGQLALVAASVLVAVSPLQAGAQSAGEQPAISLPFTRQHEVHSRVNGQEYRVLVALPVGYGSGLPSDTARYPVLYVLDGNDELPVVAEALRMLRLDAQDNKERWAGYPDVIIVGIGYPVDRFRNTFGLRATDYTPTSVAAFDSILTFTYGMPARTGGAEAFLRVLRDEIIPLVERSYRTTDDRGIMGHSAGGLFAAYALFEAPDLFRRYGILSPSLWWDNSMMFAKEASFSRGRTELPKSVFLSVGGLEDTTIMTRPMQRMVDALRGRGYRGLDLQSHVFAEENHQSVVGASLTRSLRALGYVPPPPGSKPDP